MYSVTYAKSRIVQRLYTKGAFEKGHMLEQNILKGTPRVYWGVGREALRELLKEGIVKRYGKTRHGIAYQLNNDHLAEIEDYLKKFDKIADEG